MTDTRRLADQPSSYWTDTATLPRHRALDRDLAVDVVVVGGGLTGITAAYLLKRAGRTVALVERGRLGGVDTTHTTAHLTAVTDRRLNRLADQFGKLPARAIWDAGTAAIDRIVSQIDAEDIDCDFAWVTGYLHAPVSGAGRRDRSSLEREAKIASELGIEVRPVNQVPVVDRPGIAFPNQAKFHPIRYLGGLVRTIPGDGSHVFERSAVSEVEDSPLAVKVGDHRIRAGHLVLATHTPLMGKAGILRATLFQTKLYLYTSYVVGARIPKGVAPEASFWDTDDPYRYLRIDRRRGYDYAILGGEDHKTGQRRDPGAAYRRLERALSRLFPEAEVDHRWSGQVIETNDGLPFIGETADRQFVATGFAGNGMTFGTLGAMMAVDSVIGRDNPWRELFAPERKKLRGGLLTYLAENKDYPFYLVRDRLARAETTSLRSVRRSHGKIVSVGGKKAAAYRDPEGKLHLRSPVCTHLGCIVTFNDAEKTWDCPCHGSRFRATGEVLSGPAEKDLEPFES